MLRVLSIVGLIVSIFIVGWIASRTLSAVSAPPALSVDGAPANTTGAIQQAEAIRSADLERQKQQEKLLED